MDMQTIKAAQGALKNAPSGVYVQTTPPKELVKPFYSPSRTGVADVLEQARNEWYQTLFMPELALARVDSQELWKDWYAAPSFRATGKTKQGAKVVLYAHVPSNFSTPANIREAITNGNLVNGAGPIPQAEFNRLVSLDGNGRVFVVEYDTLRKAPSDVISVDAAFEHPQTIPFLGGEATAKAYLAKHKEMYGNRIGIWHSDDFNKDTPLGRVLCFGYDGSLGLYGDYGIDDDGRVLAVAPEAQSVAKIGEAANVPLEQRVEMLKDGKVLKLNGKTYILAPEGLNL